MRISKYKPLTDYLYNSQDEYCRLTFKQIEGLIQDHLPDCAYTYATVFWNDANGHYAKHWLRAGRVVSQYDITQGYAIFKKDSTAAEYHLSRAGQKSTERKQVTAKVTQRKPCPTVSCDDLISASRRYADDMAKDEHARYLSWEHCYGFFQKNHINPNDEQMDLMCLHLAWYLASWGMLRGGSFLLQKDYRVHMPVVRLLLSDEYRDLYNCSVNKLSSPQVIDKIMDLSQKIVAIYKGLTNDIGDGEGKIASDTLITKILLGTIGCTPAYDRYFKSGLSLSKVAQQRYGTKSLSQLVAYYLDHYEQFEAFRKEISQSRVEYTPMKIIDMCFWQIGFDDGTSGKQNESDE